VGVFPPNTNYSKKEKKKVINNINNISCPHGPLNKK